MKVWECWWKCERVCANCLPAFKTRGPGGKGKPRWRVLLWCFLGRAPGIPVHSFHGTSKRERERTLNRVQRRGGVLLTTYGMVLTSWEQLSSYNGRDFVWVSESVCMCARACLHVCVVWVNLCVCALFGWVSVCVCVHCLGECVWRGVSVCGGGWGVLGFAKCMVGGCLSESLCLCKSWALLGGWVDRGRCLCEWVKWSGPWELVWAEGVVLVSEWMIDRQFDWVSWSLVCLLAGRTLGER